MTEDRRHDGFYFTSRQFAALLGAILSIQVAVNWWAAQSWVHEIAVKAIQIHNVDQEAHARALLVAQQERTEMIKQIVVLQTKIDGVENMLRVLSAQNVFTPPNGNGRR